jgi:hypothetical protein
MIITAMLLAWRGSAPCGIFQEIRWAVRRNPPQHLWLEGVDPAVHPGRSADLLGLFHESVNHPVSIELDHTAVPGIGYVVDSECDWNASGAVRCQEAAIIEPVKHIAIDNQEG